MATKPMRIRTLKLHLPKCERPYYTSSGWKTSSMRRWDNRRKTQITGLYSRGSRHTRSGWHNVKTLTRPSYAPVPSPTPPRQQQPTTWKNFSWRIHHVKHNIFPFCSLAAVRTNENCTWKIETEINNGNKIKTWTWNWKYFLGNPFFRQFSITRMLSKRRTK